MFTVPEIETSIRKLDSGKSPDEYGLCAEHFRYDNDIVSEHITTLFSQYPESKFVLAAFKNWNINTCIKER